MGFILKMKIQIAAAKTNAQIIMMAFLTLCLLRGTYVIPEILKQYHPAFCFKQHMK